MLYDAIVVGVGGMGSAALCHLARRGARVLGLEQFEIPHDRGSSHGVSRIIRLAYWEHPDYVPLVRRAYDLWIDLERACGERLLIVTGSVDGGLPDSRMIRGSLAACETHGLRHELFDSASLTKRFPGYRFPSDHVGVFQPDGGFLLSERCIVAHADAARAAGADIHTHETVREWHAADDAVRVTTDRGEYRGQHLIVTAGPWLPRLVPALASALTVERQVVIWTRPLRPELFEPDRFPVFYVHTDAGAFYGFPLDSARGFKIGKYHHRRQTTDPDGVDRICSPEDEAAVREGLMQCFPDAAGPTVATSTCLFTNTADEHFVIDRWPMSDRVLIAGGFSGHGFKFCTAVGEIVADLVERERNDVNLFRIDRLNSP